MSKPLAALDVLHLQRLYKCAGFYGGKLDGAWGPKTDGAAVAWEQVYSEIRGLISPFDSRSEALLHTVLPGAQRLARLFLRVCIRNGFDVRILSGTRSYAEQDALYRQGRNGNKGPRVTNARGGQSLHNFGIAWDVGVFREGRYISDGADLAYTRIAALRPSRVEWGGDWQSLKDMPHYQVATGLELAEVRRRFEAGELRLEAAA